MSQKSIYLVHQRYKCHRRVFTLFIKGISVTKKLFITLVKGTNVTNGYLLSSSKVLVSQKSISYFI